MPDAHAGQAPAAPDTTATTWFLRNWTRAELWRFFAPSPSASDHQYAFAANRLQAGVRRRAPRYEVLAALQYVQFGGLPAAAAGGTGAAYYSHAGRTDSHQVYLRYLNVQLKELARGLSVQVGRMPYSSGGEASSGRPRIDVVKRQRVEARLIGEFDWSLYQRGFDGLRLDLVKPAWTITGTAYHPTQGGFEDAAGLMMNDVTVIGGVATIRPGAVIPGFEWQAFAFRYADARAVAARPDNSGRAAAVADVGITTFGTTLVGASPEGERRQWDGLLWLAGQNGSGTTKRTGRSASRSRRGTNGALCHGVPGYEPGSCAPPATMTRLTIGTARFFRCCRPCGATRRRPATAR